MTRWPFEANCTASGRPILPSATTQMFMTTTFLLVEACAAGGPSADVASQVLTAITSWPLWFVVVVMTCRREPRRTRVRCGTGRAGPRRAAAPVVPRASTSAMISRSSPPGATSASSPASGDPARTVVPVSSPVTATRSPTVSPARSRMAEASRGRSGRGLWAVTEIARFPSNATETVSNRAHPVRGRVRDVEPAVGHAEPLGRGSRGSRRTSGRRPPPPAGCPPRRPGGSPRAGRRGRRAGRRRAAPGTRRGAGRGSRRSGSARPASRTPEADLLLGLPVQRQEVVLQELGDLPGEVPQQHGVAALARLDQAGHERR